MGSVCIRYLSGTGNSLRAAQWFAEEAVAVGYESDLRPIETGQITHPGDLVALMFPTHGFTAPWSMIMFACRLPRCKGSRFAVVATRGSTIAHKLRIPGMEGTAAYLIAFILMLKGYRLSGVLGLDMPSNWTALHWGISPKMAARITGKSELAVRAFAKDILSGKPRIGGLVCLVLGIALLPVSFIYIFLGRFLLAKLFFASSSCDACGICVSNCPNHALSWFGKRPFWTIRCESCMRCMNYCPKKAIQAGHSWGVVVWYLTNIPIAMWLLNQVPLPHWDLLRLVIQLPYMLLSTCVSYLLVSRLLQFRWINAFFTYTTLTILYRRYHEPGMRLKDFGRH